MNEFEKLPIHSLIRIYNYYENDKGYGWQIIENNLSEILDMQDNYNWSDEQLMKFIKYDTFKINSKYVYCGNNHMQSISEKDIKNYVLKNILNQTLNGELQEIVNEELNNIK